MFKENQEVRISSTAELTTIHKRGWIIRQSKTHPEFWTVLTEKGNTAVFHESQLSVPN